MVPGAAQRGTLPRLGRIVTNVCKKGETVETKRNYWASQVSRRRLLAGTGTAGMAGLFLAACGGSSSNNNNTNSGAAPKPSASVAAAPASATAAVRGSTVVSGGFTSAPSPTIPAQTPVRGGRTVRSFTGDPVNFDIHSGISFLNVEFIDYWHSKLVRYDYRATPPYKNGGEVVIGELASSWEAAPDNASWTFHLKPGMKFHNKPPVNGRVLTADDVKWTWERALSPGHVVEEWAWLTVYDKIEAIDANTVKFTLKAPNGRLPQDMECYQTYVLPREADEKIGLDKIEGATIGAGPWLFDSYQPGSRWVGKANPDYKAFPGVPYLDQNIALIIASGAPAEAAFRAKQIDIGGAATPANIPALKASNPDIQWHQGWYAATSTNVLVMNVAEPPFNDIRVRHAVSMAIDRDSWLKTPFYAAGGKLESGPVTWGEGDWKLDPSQLGTAGQWLKYDPQQAKQLLAAAGFPNGLTTTLSQTPQYGADSTAQGELMQQFLGKVGITANIATIEYSQWIATTYLGQFHGLMWGPDNLDRLSQQMLSRFASWSTRNHGNVKDPNTDKMLADWRAISDTQKSKQAAWDIQKYLADQSYWVFAPQGTSNSAWQPYLKNFEGETVFDYENGFRNAFLWTDPVQKAT